jgi:hypothetical protein
MAIDSTIKAAYLEELRFAKRQQWTITAAVVALIAGAYNVVKPLGPCDKVLATILVTAVVVAGIWWAFDLQGHLHRTRLRTDPYDREPESPGWPIVYGMVVTMILSATAVCYLFWRELILGM